MKPPPEHDCYSNKSGILPRLRVAQSGAGAGLLQPDCGRAGRQDVAHGHSPAASAAQASGKKAGGAAKPDSQDLTVRKDTPSAAAACCWV